MIAQVLNQGFVESVRKMVIADLREAANSEARRSGAPHPADDVKPELFAEALSVLEDASPPAGSSERRGEGVVDDYAYIPRDATLNLLQSAIERWFEEENQAIVTSEPPPDDRRGGGEEVMLADRYLPDMPPETGDGRRWFGAFEVAKPIVFSDPRWISAVFAMGMRDAVYGRHPFKKEPVSYEIPDIARVVIVGDWASGIPRALKVRDQIVKVLEESGPERHVIHLGDVYYSGWPHEYEKRMLGPWPVKKSDATVIRSWNLNGNHDMYCGGDGYFKTGLGDVRFAAQGGCSYFRLHNSEWDIVGLDTAHQEAGLKDPQGEWLGEMDPQRKLMLLSHHQPFSAYQDGMPDLRGKLVPLLREREVDAWFWGHEHRCMRYKPHDRIRYGCCIGNGGVPEYMPRDPGDPVKEPGEWEFRKRKKKLGQPWGAFGFAVLDLNGKEVTARYIDEDGETFCTERVA